MAEDRHPSPEEEAKRLYEEAETRTARAFEKLVSRDSFAELLARATENTVALTKIWTDVFDLALRNLRLAGRQDVIRLARQLGRTEDKIEMLLQEVERLQDRLGVDGPPRLATDGRHTSSRNGAGERPSGERRAGATTGGGERS